MGNAHCNIISYQYILPRHRLLVIVLQGEGTVMVGADFKGVTAKRHCQVRVLSSHLQVWVAVRRKLDGAQGEVDLGFQLLGRIAKDGHGLSRMQNLFWRKVDGGREHIMISEKIWMCNPLKSRKI